jgi:hypothetical protein
MVMEVASHAGRLRQAFVSNLNAPTVWSIAVFALVGVIIAAALALVALLPDQVVIAVLHWSAGWPTCCATHS